MNGHLLLSLRAEDQVLHHRHEEESRYVCEAGAPHAFVPCLRGEDSLIVVGDTWYINTNRAREFAREQQPPPPWWPLQDVQRPNQVRANFGRRCLIFALYVFFPPEFLVSNNNNKSVRNPWLALASPLKKWGIDQKSSCKSGKTIEKRTSSPAPRGISA